MICVTSLLLDNVIHILLLTFLAFYVGEFTYILLYSKSIRFIFCDILAYNLFRILILLAISLYLILIGSILKSILAIFIFIVIIYGFADALLLIFLPVRMVVKHSFVTPIGFIGSDERIFINILTK